MLAGSGCMQATYFKGCRDTPHPPPTHAWGNTTASAKGLAGSFPGFISLVIEI